MIPNRFCNYSKTFFSKIGRHVFPHRIWSCKWLSTYFAMELFYFKWTIMWLLNPLGSTKGFLQTQHMKFFQHAWAALCRRKLRADRNILKQISHLNFYSTSEWIVWVSWVNKWVFEFFNLQNLPHKFHSWWFSLLDGQPWVLTKQKLL